MVSLALAVGIIAQAMLLNQAPQLNCPLFKGSQDESGLILCQPDVLFAVGWGLMYFFCQLRPKINIKSGFTEAIYLQSALGSVLF